MINRIVLRVRAVLLSLAVASAVSLVCIAAPAMAEPATSANVPSPYLVASENQPDAYLAQQAKKRPKAERTADSDEETAAVQKYLKETSEWLKKLPGIGTFVSVMPQLWTPFRVAALLSFLAFFVLYHFRRQQRNLLETEQNRHPSAAEAEFGVVADSEGKEVRP